MATTLSECPSSSKRITTITIVHKTGRPRIIDDQQQIQDIRFNDLVASMNKSEAFGADVKVIYCKFAKNQVSKLVSNTDFAINSATVREKQNGLMELTLTRNKKHFEDVKLFN